MAGLIGAFNATGVEDAPGSALEDSGTEFAALNFGAGASGFEESEFWAGTLLAFAA